MIKLETKSQGLSALSFVSIASLSQEPTIALSCDKARRLDDVTNQWVDDPTRLKQVVVYVGSDGPVELSGLVPENVGIEIAAAWRVVVQVDFSARNMPATRVGGFSRSVLSVALVQVVEVWESPTKVLYRDKAYSAGPGKTFDLGTGKIAAA